MKTSEFLGKAHDHLAEHGHCKGELKDEESRVCLKGAMIEALAAADLTESEEIQLAGRGNKAIAEALRADGIEVIDILGFGGWSLETHKWNDLPSTTKEDVLMYMKRAASTLADQGD